MIKQEDKFNLNNIGLNTLSLNTMIKSKISLNNKDNYLSDWINQKYLSLNSIKKLQLKFKLAQPYSFLELRNFFNKDKIKFIEQAILTINFEKKETDLFSFYQTIDLVSVNDKVLREFHQFLSSNEFLNYLHALSGLKLKPNTIAMSGTRYLAKNYLLPHDDQLEGRALAYFLYLSYLNNKDGGKLELYGKNKDRKMAVINSIIPRKNTFAFFQVSNRSFHQVEEVVSNKERLAISGWFHHA
ncbi:2OG-Fe(II) oxygenase [Candidatus Woesearchaeota archaeon]|nr:2OG-Fe(II) oxygenase [Candidatus Woesearchaeota archaeon]